MKAAKILIPQLVVAFAVVEWLLVSLTGLPSPPPRKPGGLEVALNAIVFAQVGLAVLWGAMVRLSIGPRVALAVAAPALGGFVVSLVHPAQPTLSIATAFLVAQAMALSMTLAIGAAAGFAYGRPNDAAKTGDRRRWQTSIGSLLLLTTITAVSLSLLKWLVRLDDLRLVLDKWVWPVYPKLGIGNLALCLGLAWAMLGTGTRPRRIVVGLAGLAVCIAMYRWSIEQIGGRLLVVYVAVQTIALAIGLVHFFACGWRFQWRPGMRNRLAD